jgi:hypothetical protein
LRQQRRMPRGIFLHTKPSRCGIARRNECPGIALCLTQQGIQSRATPTDAQHDLAARMIDDIAGAQVSLFERMARHRWIIPDRGTAMRYHCPRKNP